MGTYYFLMCLLPSLPSAPGDKMPLPFAELSGTVRRHIQPDHDALLRSHLGVIDASNFENRKLGRSLFLEGGTVVREDLDAGRNLPEFIRMFQEEHDRGSGSPRQTARPRNRGLPQAPDCPRPPPPAPRFVCTNWPGSRF